MDFGNQTFIALKTLHELRNSTVEWNLELQEKIVDDAVSSIQYDRQHFGALFAEKNTIRIFLMMLDDRIDTIVEESV